MTVSIGGTCEGCWVWSVTIGDTFTGRQCCKLTGRPQPHERHPGCWMNRTRRYRVAVPWVEVSPLVTQCPFEDFRRCPAIHRAGTASRSTANLSTNEIIIRVPQDPSFRVARRPACATSHFYHAVSRSMHDSLSGQCKKEVSRTIYPVSVSLAVCNARWAARNRTGTEALRCVSQE